MKRLDLEHGGVLYKQASEASKELPRDYKLLTAIVADPSVAIEQRAKILEVMIFRGAVNHRTYTEMGTKEDSNYLKYHREWREHRLYQEAARDAIFRDPELFNQLSKSSDQMPQGRTAATEIMNTMLKNGGMYGAHAGRQEFEERLKAVPPDTRGRMMYHLEDAGQSGDIHLKGERRLTGVSAEASVGNFGIGLGASWDHVADNHWREVGKDVNREIVANLNKGGEIPIEQFSKGYLEAKGQDKLPGIGP